MTGQDGKGQGRVTREGVEDKKKKKEEERKTRKKINAPLQRNIKIDIEFISLTLPRLVLVGVWLFLAPVHLSLFFLFFFSPDALGTYIVSAF